MLVKKSDMIYEEFDLASQGMIISQQCTYDSLASILKSKPRQNQKNQKQTNKQSLIRYLSFQLVSLRWFDIWSMCSICLHAESFLIVVGSWKIMNAVSFGMVLLLQVCYFVLWFRSFCSAFSWTRNSFLFNLNNLFTSLYVC